MVYQSAIVSIDVGAGENAKGDADTEVLPRGALQRRALECTVAGTRLAGA